MKALVAVLVLAALILSGVLFYRAHFGFRYPPGKPMAAALPLQKKVTEKKQWKREGYLIKALAEFDITARVLIAERYYTGRESDLSPMDLTLAWGPASDTAFLEKVSFYKLDRYYRYEWDEPGIDKNEIKNHTANMHMIGAYDSVNRQLKKVGREDIVHLKGYLVRVEATDGWHWQSSLSREDSGNGACELVWVEELEVR